MNRLINICVVSLCGDTVHVSICAEVTIQANALVPVYRVKVGVNQKTDDMFVLCYINGKRERTTRYEVAGHII